MDRRDNSQGTQALEQQLLSTPVFNFDEPCPYLSGRPARMMGFFARSVPDGFYRRLLDHSFRRSGTLFYSPACNGCRECRQLRVPVERFAASKSQRRCWRRNADLAVDIGRPELTDEKWDLYVSYQKLKHGRAEEKNMGALHEFLYNPVVSSLEFCYRDSVGRLVAVGICDLLEDALSSVYCYYDASQPKRGLGTYTVLYELAYAKQQSLRYYYLGYYVRDCQAMRYKAAFRPCEILQEDGRWRECSQE